MNTVISLALPATAFMLLVAVGIDLTPEDFARVRRQPAVVLTGLIAPLILLPPTALWLTSTFETTPDVTTGLLLIASCPIGGISNTYSYLARASTALSVTLTGISCLCASLTIPLVSKGIELVLARPLEIEAPVSVLVGQVLLVLALPVGFGMWARRHSPALAMRYAPILQRMAFVGVAITLLLIVRDDPDAFWTGLSTTVPLVAAFVLISMVVGWITAALITPDRADRFTIAAEFGTRNVSIAATVAVTFLGRTEFARVVAAYALTEVPLLLGAVTVFRYWQRRVATPILSSD